uniref:Uncharacterized protein n=2 Tax=Cuerna arida TaxID=1464854 RepID=A0A1B6GU53_9HEMI
MIKLKSELAHYRQMFVEQSHTVTRLSKLVTNLKGDRILLKDKLLQQEKKANKFILEMAQRFDNSRKEFNIVISKKLEEQRDSPEKLAIHKLVDRNARLAYDNSMLKLELDMLKKQLLERRIEENKLHCLTGRSVQYSKEANNFDFENPHLEKCGNSNTFNTLKASVSEKSGLTNVSFQNCTIAVKTSVTSLISRNKKSVLMWQPDLDPRSISKVSNSNQVNSSAESSEDVRLMRVFSAPQLTASRGSLAIKDLQDLKTK